MKKHKPYTKRIWHVIENDGFYRVFYKTEKERFYSAKDLPETVKQFITDSELKDDEPDRYGYRSYWGRFDD